MTVISHLIPLKKLKKAKIRNRHNQVAQQIQDTIWENDKNTEKHHPQERQEVSPFYHKVITRLQGTNKTLN